MWAVWPTIAQELNDNNEKSSNHIAHSTTDPGAHQEAAVQAKMTNLRQEKRWLEAISTNEETTTGQDVDSETWSRFLFPVFTRGMSSKAKSTKRNRTTVAKTKRNRVQPTGRTRTSTNDRYIRETEV
jgi:hypothetical protein